MINVKKWKAPNGNVCFHFSMHRTFERPWIIISSALIAFVICIIEILFFGSYNLFIPITIFLMILFIWWVDNPSNKNKTIIANTVYEIMGNFVDKDTNAVGAKVVRRMVNHDIKGTYGIVESSCLIVLLDNDEVWEYPIIYHNSEKYGVYFECERNHIVSDNQKHIRKVNPKRLKRFISKLKLPEKTCLGLLLTIILIIGALSFWGFVSLFIHFNWWIILIVVVYVSSYSLMERIYSNWPNKFLNIIRIVMSIPITILYLLFKTVFPFITIVGTYIFVILFAFGLPAMILTGISRLGWLMLKPETITFIVISLGSIVCSHSYRITKWLIHQTPLRDWGNHNYESYREQLAVYLIHPSNVIFLLYLIYCVCLSISGFLQIENESYLISEGYDAAILKAFLVFIAFTNMRIKAKDAKVDAKELFQRTLKLFVHD